MAVRSSSCRTRQHKNSVRARWHTRSLNMPKETYHLSFSLELLKGWQKNTSESLRHRRDLVLLQTWTKPCVYRTFLQNVHSLYVSEPKCSRYSAEFTFLWKRECASQATVWLLRAQKVQNEMCQGSGCVENMLSACYVSTSLDMRWFPPLSFTFSFTSHYSEDKKLHSLTTDPRKLKKRQNITSHFTVRFWKDNCCI